MNAKWKTFCKNGSTRHPARLALRDAPEDYVLIIGAHGSVSLSGPFAVVEDGSNMILVGVDDLVRACISVNPPSRVFVDSCYSGYVGGPVITPRRISAFDIFVSEWEISGIPVGGHYGAPEGSDSWQKAERFICL